MYSKFFFLCLHTNSMDITNDLFDHQEENVIDLAGHEIFFSSFFCVSFINPSFSNNFFLLEKQSKANQNKYEPNHENPTLLSESHKISQIHRHLIT